MQASLLHAVYTQPLQFFDTLLPDIRRLLGRLAHEAPRARSSAHADEWLEVWADVAAITVTHGRKASFAALH